VWANGRTHVLEIEFHGGRVYRYFDVPKRTYDGLMAAASHGKYHHRRINGRFRYTRIQ
jgi:hypothetical protein